MLSVDMYGNYYHRSNSPYLYERQLQHQLQPELVEQRTFTRQDILRHNASVRWQQWVTLKGIVYEATGFRDHFLAYIKKKKDEKAKEKELNEDVSLRLDSIKDTVSVGEKKFANRGYRAGENIATWQAQAENKKVSVREQNLANRCRKLSSGSRRASAQNKFCRRRSGSHTEHKKQSSVSDGSDDELFEEDSDYSDYMWQHDVIHVLRTSGLPLAEVEAEIGPFKIGTLVKIPSWKFWESIRADVITLHDDLTKEAEAGKISDYQGEYLAQLRQWLRRYRDIDPLHRPQSAGDPNNNVFLLSQDPSTLREWMRDFVPLDTELPETGAWARAELVLPPLGDTHEVFASVLRSHFSNDVQLDFGITGEAAWKVLSQNVVRDDQMTQKQKAVQAERDQRGNSLGDPERMSRQRRKLGRYFMKKYHISQEEMAGFLQWGTVMEDNQRELDKLCNE